MEFPEDLKYSSEHEWVAVDGSRARIGITDYAQDALGDVVFVNLPAAGASVSSGSTSAEVNTALDDTPEQLNADPYGSGWIFVVEMSDPAELDALLDAAGYRALV